MIESWKQDMLTKSEGFDDSLLYAAVANGAK